MFNTAKKSQNYLLEKILLTFFDQSYYICTIQNRRSITLETRAENRNFDLQKRLCNVITLIICTMLSSPKFNWINFKQLFVLYQKLFLIALFFDGINSPWKTLPSFPKMTALIYLCALHMQGIDACKYILSKFGPRPFIWAQCLRKKVFIFLLKMSSKLMSPFFLMPLFLAILSWKRGNHALESTIFNQHWRSLPIWKALVTYNMMGTR